MEVRVERRVYVRSTYSGSRHLIEVEVQIGLDGQVDASSITPTYLARAHGTCPMRSTKGL